MRWGMSGFEEQEQTRPQYKGIRFVHICAVCTELPLYSIVMLHGHEDRKHVCPTSVA